MAVRRWAAWRQTNDRGPSQDVGGDLLAAVGGQAVQHDGVRGREVDQLLVDREALEGRRRGEPFLFLSHAGPHVGVEHSGALGRLVRIVGQLHRAPRPARSALPCRAASS